MNPIKDIYKPFDFSATRCYVFDLIIEKKGFLKIEHNLPIHIKKLKGIFVSVNYSTGSKNVSGLISMNFNGQSFKSFQSIVYKTNELYDRSRPNPFNEVLLPNTLIQGYYYDLTKTLNYPYTVRIYLHYENEEYK